ncbi:uncharacterized protein BT62DRAFT_1012096 [Guyanagaster necrorhizus]|uniref:Uncharacterized protein n=1 Tax=Guyanagaster necrorhizus TaxID=856835 RepID=A0A9P7VHC9_9AGAR|nr:uncharacterized protein BT62DRAFT_1012096 [Guyanagaster necrorhizus MCA 3950]KAG7441061.1 hypothetical protein BT62DRAFT_1012096 [Guyanagaster necrorhizus MCA 3950]
MFSADQEQSDARNIDNAERDGIIHGRGETVTVTGRQTIVLPSSLPSTTTAELAAGDSYDLSRTSSKSVTLSSRYRWKGPHIALGAPTRYLPTGRCCAHGPRKMSMLHLLPRRALSETFLRSVVGCIDYRAERARQRGGQNHREYPVVKMREGGCSVSDIFGPGGEATAGGTSGLASSSSTPG